MWEPTILSDTSGTESEFTGRFRRLDYSISRPYTIFGVCRGKSFYICAYIHTYIHAYKDKLTAFISTDNLKIIPLNVAVIDQ
jgi:hypothetical protein